MIYWTDIPNARLYRCRQDGTKLEKFEVPAAVGGFTIQEDGSLLLFMARGTVAIWRNGEVLSTVIETIREEVDGRFNDVIADPLGGVYCGTMSTRKHGGRFYHMATDGTLELLVEGMGTPNGMGFSPDRRWFYQNDSRESVMYRWRYDSESGSIADREVHISVDRNGGKGRPDGMVVDTEGCLWTARWEGYRLVRHDPQGNPLDEIRFPARNVSSLTIAGDDRRTAFVTTAACDDRTANGALAGSLFRVSGLPADGQPEFRSRVKT